MTVDGPKTEESNSPLKKRKYVQQKKKTVFKSGMVTTRKNTF